MYISFQGSTANQNAQSQTTSAENACSVVENKIESRQQQLYSEMPTEGVNEKSITVVTIPNYIDSIPPTHHNPHHQTTQQPPQAQTLPQQQQQQQQTTAVRSLTHPQNKLPSNNLYHHHRPIHQANSYPQDHESYHIPVNHENEPTGGYSVQMATIHGYYIPPIHQNNEHAQMHH